MNQRCFAEEKKIIAKYWSFSWSSCWVAVYFVVVCSANISFEMGSFGIFLYLVWHILLHFIIYSWFDGMCVRRFILRFHKNGIFVARKWCKNSLTWSSPLSFQSLSLPLVLFTHSRVSTICCLSFKRAMLSFVSEQMNSV